MKLPKKPPRISLQDTLRFGVELDSRVNSPLWEGEYVHWDRLRRLPMPEGIPHEACWGALSFHRRGQRKSIPLRDKSGEPFSFCDQVDPIPERLHRLTQEASGRLSVAGPPPDPGQRDRYIVSSLIEEAIASSQIEGADTSRKVAREMLRENRKPRDRAERMIANNHECMEYVREVRTETMTPELLFRIHERITRETLENPEEAGRLRAPGEAPVHVFERDTNTLLFTPPPAEELPQRIEALCDFANGRTPDFFLHPVLRSILLHFWLAYDHPFGDGNGRTARILFYWSMLRHGYWLFEFVPISPLVQKALKKYLRAFLETETDGNDLTYFILYHLDLLDKAIDELRRYLKRTREEMKQLERQLRNHESLNHRQRALLAHALKHPDQRYTFRSHQTSHKIAYQTARTDLLGMEEAGLLRHTRRGRTLLFRPAGDLTERLKRPDNTD